MSANVAAFAERLSVDRERSGVPEDALQDITAIGDDGYLTVLSAYAWYFRSEEYLCVKARTGQGLQRDLINKNWARKSTYLRKRKSS